MSQGGLLTSAGSLTITRDSLNGRITGTTLGNVTTTQTYNSKGELATYVAKYNTTTLFSTSYSRDSLGRITQLTETVQGITKTFRYAYDTTGRLQNVWRNDTLISTYMYDSNGNRLSHIIGTDTTHATYDDQDRLLTYGNATYVYSKFGDLQKRIVGSDTTHHTYDAFGSLVSVKLPNGDLIEYLLDGNGLRVGKKLNGVVTQKWLYSNNLRIVAEMDSSNNIKTRFVYTTSENVPEYIVKNDTAYRLVTDHLGSVRQVVKTQTGAIVQKIDYDEYGNVLFDSNPSFSMFAFAGGLYETSTKLVRFGGRDYDALVGRWTTKDPIRFVGGQNNLYAYVGNDAINNLDSKGESALGAFIEIIGAIYSLAMLDVRGAAQHAIGAIAEVAEAGTPVGSRAKSTLGKVGVHFDKWGNLAKSNNAKALDRRFFDFARGFEEGFAGEMVEPGLDLPKSSKPLNKSGALYVAGYALGSYLGNLIRGK